MKLRQGPKWKNSNGLQWNRDNMVEVLTAIGAAVVFDLVCVLFFLYASCHMVGMIYPLQENSPAFLVRAVGLTLLFGLLFEGTAYAKRIPRLCIRWGVLTGGVWLMVHHVLKAEV
jgi:hypothetical protein